MTRQQGYETKRDRIAISAWTLFMRDGYQATPVDAILREAKISKGTFYHYYRTKEALLHHAVELLYGSAWEQVRRIAHDDQVPPVHRLNEITRRAFAWRKSKPADVWEAMQGTYSEENLRLRNLLDRRTVEEVAPALARVLAAGTEQGDFSLVDPDESAALILRLAHAQKEANARTLLESTDLDEAATTIHRRLIRLVEAVERILGAKEGMLDRYDTSFLAALFEARKQAESADPTGVT